MISTFAPGPDFIIQPGNLPQRMFFYRRNRLLVKNRNGRPELVNLEDLPQEQISQEDTLALGRIDDAACGAHRFPEDYSPPAEWHFEGLRSLYGRLDDATMAAAGYGLQIFRWMDAQRYCGRCGAATALHRGERALACTACGQVLFPQVAPAVIVAVISEKRLLLARAGRYAGRMFSVLAGYVEPGETLEECVRREVREEVGIEIGNIRYFGSQPWPFSGSLMVAFTAEHAGGRLAVDHKEIVEAGWFTPADLPRIPGTISIARQLIDWYVDRYGSGRS